MARYCLSPRCPEVVNGKMSYCERHEPRREPWRGSKSEARGWEWTRIRKRVLERDSRRCVICGAPANQVDAIVPSAEGGSHLDMKNLRSLCTDHHAEKTNEDRLRGLRRKGR